MNHQYISFSIRLVVWIKIKILQEQRKFRLFALFYQVFDNLSYTHLDIRESYCIFHSTRPRFWQRRYIIFLWFSLNLFWYPTRSIQLWMPDILIPYIRFQDCIDSLILLAILSFYFWVDIRIGKSKKPRKKNFTKKESTIILFSFFFF